MGKAADYPGPPEALERYEALVATVPGVARKGAKNPYTSRNGHMFSFLDADGVVAIRLSDERWDAFCEAYESGPVEQYGKTMRGYVSVPADLELGELQPWFRESYEWIGTLPAKATTTRRRSTKPVAR